MVPFHQLSPPEACIHLASPPYALLAPPISLLYLITRTIFGEQYRSLSSTSCSFLHSSVTSSLSGPNIPLNILFLNTLSGRGSSVGIATHYRMDGPGIESRWGGEIFCIHPDRPWGPTSFVYDGYWVSFPEVKRPGRGVDNPPPILRRCWRKSKAIHIIPLWGFVACSREYFTFTFKCLARIWRTLLYTSIHKFFYTRAWPTCCYASKCFEHN